MQIKCLILITLFNHYFLLNKKQNFNFKLTMLSHYPNHPKRYLNVYYVRAYAKKLFERGVELGICVKR